MSDRVFVTVHDLDLSAEETTVWGGLPTTPEAYPCVDGMTPRDAALAHIVLLCLERGAFAAARRYAAMMTDPRMREVRLGLIPQDGTT